MKNKVLRWILLFGIINFIQAGSQAIYNPDMDVKAEIQKAIERAQKENKHILLKFGANWCPWCRALYKTMHTNEELNGFLKKNYIVILVDIGETKDKPLNRDLMEKYRVNGFGVPALAVLDQKGNLLTAQSTGVLEEGKGHNVERILNFLRANAP